MSLASTGKLSELLAELVYWEQQAELRGPLAPDEAKRWNDVLNAIAEHGFKHAMTCREWWKGKSA